MSERTSKEVVRKVWEGAPLKVKLLMRIARFLPERKRFEIFLKYMLPKIFTEALKEVRNQMGEEAWQKMIEYLPLRVVTKDGYFELPAGTSKEEQIEFLKKLRFKREEGEGGDNT